MLESFDTTDQNGTTTQRDWLQDGQLVKREIITSKGLLDEALLVKVEGGFENDDERTTWQEWRLDGELVKREAQVQLKKWPEPPLGELGVFA